MKQAVLALDQGTTSSRVILFDLCGHSIKSFQLEFSCSYPKNGWVEQDANQIWADCYALLGEALSYADSNSIEIISLGISNQRETTVFFDSATQEALCPAIVWQDRRTTDYCQRLKEDGNEEWVSAKTGLVIDPYFSASKIRWALHNIDSVKNAHAQGRLLVGTIDSWLLYKLSAGQIHATDSSNASRTMLLDITSNEWCRDLADLFEVPLSILPEVRDTIDDFGLTAEGLFSRQIAVRALIGDQQAATIGQGCLAVGEGKCTLGTGAFAMTNIGSDLTLANSNLLSTILYSRDGDLTYANEGSIFSCGSTMTWLRDSLGIISNTSDSERIAAGTSSNLGVYLVPAFSGLGTPHWESNARAIICGLSGAATQNEIIRAALESVSYQCLDLFGDSPPSTLNVDGGMSSNNWLLQNLADILQCNVRRAENLEATAWGAARCAASDLDLLNPVPDELNSGRLFSPQMDKSERDILISGWRQAVARCLHQ
ncbi:MAG: glycerol kinase GlpK [Planctomycetota bacterium]|nr:glycerol kinase GlpK [Planctomycetota bacterium]